MTFASYFTAAGGQRAATQQKQASATDTILSHHVINPLASAFCAAVRARGIGGALERSGVGSSGAGDGARIGWAGNGRSVLEERARTIRMPPGLAVMNAANLCPAPRPVLETLVRETESVDHDPSPHNRARLYPEKEQTRKALAEFLRVTPEEIIITRNTSESNNLVSSGLDLKAGDEVVVHARQPSEQPHSLAGEGQAIRFHGRRGRAKESASRHGVLPREPSRARSRREQRRSASRICRVRSAI